MPEIVIIYHGPCTDGFTAAWAAWKVFKDSAVYVEASHGMTPPDVTDKEVFILDFAYPRDVMLDMQKKAVSITVLDHHESAQEDLAGLSGCVFDMYRSGAGLAWDRFNKGTRPLLVTLVEDSDLNLFENPLTVPILTRLELEPRTFDNWSRIAELLEDPARVELWLDEAKPLLHQREIFYKQSLSNKYELVLNGHKGLACNAPFWAASELGNRLGAESGTFGLVWFRNGSKLKCSLRSNRGGFDVKGLAKVFGGGGHQNSSAFTLTTIAENLNLINGLTGDSLESEQK